MKNFLASFVNQDGVAFPATAAVNSSGGGATDGTEFVKIFVDDLWGWMQEVLNYTDDTPNGSSEVGVGNSQLLASMIKMLSNITEVSSNGTHTVENFDKRSMLIISAGCTIERLVGGTGADESNRILVQNNNTVTVEIDFGAAADQEEIIMQPGQWIELIYDSEATKFVFLKSNMQIIITTAVDYTIGDWVPSGTKILVNCNTAAQYGLITITLPTMAANIGKWYEIEHGSAQGLIMVDGEGGETLNFKGKQILTNLIYSSGMGYKYSNNGTDWVMKGCNKMMKNYNNRSDWTAVHAGNGVTYDDGSTSSTKSVDFTGMVVSEATSGFTGIVVEDTGGAGDAGTFYVYELSSGFTFWTNDRVLTASNGETIDVNEGSGSSKNIDYDFYHEFGVNLKNINKTLVVSTDGTENNSLEIGVGNSRTADHGFTPYQVSTNAIKFQCGSSGLAGVQDTGATLTVAAQDWYEDLILDFSA